MLEYAQIIFTALPGIILGAFSLYFAIQKIGHNVHVSYTVLYSRTAENKISEMLLFNKKNKVISITSMHVLINKKIIIELNEYKPPRIIKPFESVYLGFPNYSYLYIDNKPYSPKFISPEKIEIYLLTSNKKIKCKVINPTPINALITFKNYQPAKKLTLRFRDKVYNNNVKFSITYKLDKKIYTALIENSGFITEDWGFTDYSIPQNYMDDANSVYSYLSSLGYDNFLEGMRIDTLDHNPELKAQENGNS